MSYEARFRTLKPRAGVVKEEHMEIVLRKCQFGDWFVIYLMAKNLHSLHFKDFMSELARRLDAKNYNDIAEA